MNPGGDENYNYAPHHDPDCDPDYDLFYNMYPLVLVDPCDALGVAPTNDEPIDPTPADLLFYRHFPIEGLVPLLQDETHLLSSQAGQVQEKPHHSDQRQYLGLDIHYQQALVNGEQLKQDPPYSQYVGQQTVGQEKRLRLSPLPDDQQPPLPDDQQPVPKDQNAPHTAKNQETVTMANNKAKVTCEGCGKALGARSMYNHKKICRKLNSEDELDLPKCTLPVLGGGPEKICNTLHRSKTALRDHQQTRHHYFAPGEASYDKRISIDSSYLTRLSKTVLMARVRLEGEQLREHVDELTNDKVIENIDKQVRAGMELTKEELAERLILIRDERRALDLEILT
ncbi:uncharacterized protein QC761_0000130 [Podospora bellae-mahoneyi]|uniref:C2H2-type domain-containing protein n=1 Tax=Podospora bellae-mahoneyi TaxID=2093777 RepID=A0ABR0FTW0_9PEZI|nr:hypothetical protein QC761_0000130 [Podospora bellae-mahoneyi]